MEELAATDWSQEQKVQFCSMQFLAQSAHYQQNYPDADYFIIQQTGISAGRLYLNCGPLEHRIVDISLMPSHRSQGIGTQLLRELQNQASSAQKALTVHVESFNPAKRLYERLGFQSLETKGVYQLMKWLPIS